MSRTAGDIGLLQHLGPGIHSVPREAGCDVAAAVDGGDVEGIAETVERQRAGQRNDDATVDDALAETALGLGMLVEMHLGGVLIKTRGELVLGLLDGHAVDMVNFLANLVVAPAIGGAGKIEIIAARLDHGHSGAEAGWIDAIGELGHGILGANGGLIAFSHHHPADVFQHGLATLVAPG